MKSLTNQFVRERNEALLSLDRDKIVAYCNKYGIMIPASEEVFWLGVHKAIRNIPSIPDAAKKK